LELRSVISNGGEGFAQLACGVAPLLRRTLSSVLPRAER